MAGNIIHLYRFLSRDFSPTQYYWTKKQFNHAVKDLDDDEYCG